MQQDTSPALIGPPRLRVDGPKKVTGAAQYAGDVALPDLAHAVLVGSEAARGRLRHLDTGAAEAAPGVLAVLTHQTMPKLGEAPILLGQGAAGTPKASAGQSFQPMQGDAIHYAGQPVAVVVAETQAQAEYAASLVAATYERETPHLALGANTLAEPPVNGWPEPAAITRGDFDSGLHAAQRRVEPRYRTAMQHHVALEPHATVAAWADGSLTVYEPSTWVQGVQKTLALWLGIAESDVRVQAEFVGGSFGCKGPSWPHVALAAVAARVVGRPVKLTLSRAQTFWSVGYRPAILHTLSVGAKEDGTLTALKHEALAGAAVFDPRIVAPVTKTTPKVYACPNVVTDYKLAALNLSGPFTMRGPGETPGLFALECAIDELAYALGMDPIALRLKNYADTDPNSGSPWSSKSLRRCYAQGAERFGWAERSPKPRSMTTADGRLRGLGMAGAMYDAKSSPAQASAFMQPDGAVEVSSATCDQGTGSYTVMAQIAAEALGLPPERVRFVLGDSSLPKAPLSAGSQTAASVGSAVQAAAAGLRDKVLALACTDPASPLFGLNATQVAVREGRVSAPGRDAGETYAQIVRRAAPDGVMAEGHADGAAAEAEGVSRYSFGAHFAEVHVDPDLGEVRVARYVGAFGAGRILNAQTAQSQLQGGVIWGLGMALMEETRVDPHTGRIVNADLAEYHIPVCADVPDMNLFFVDEEDSRVNPLGVKGIGELGTVGATAAVANAVYHATGRRVRDLPITPDKML